MPLFIDFQVISLFETIFPRSRQTMRFPCFPAWQKLKKVVLLKDIPFINQYGTGYSNAF